MKKAGQEILRIRRSLGLNKLQFSKKYKIDFKYILAIESGNFIPYRIANKISNKFKIPMNDFLYYGTKN